MTAFDNHNRSDSENASVAQEADALDHWLESIGGTSRGAADLVSAGSENGLAGASESLAAVAQRAHTSIATAEQKSGPTVPVDAIWEKILATTTTPDTQSRRCRPSVDPFTNSAAPHERPARPIPAWLSGSHWAVSALLIAALVVGILAIYQSFAGTPSGPADDPTVNPGFAYSSPGSGPMIDTAANLTPISPEECDVEPRSLEEASEYMLDPGETVPREYRPVTSIETDVGPQVAEANRTWRSCTLYGLPGEYRAMESPRFISELGSSGVFGGASQDELDDAYETLRYLSDTVLSRNLDAYRIESATFEREAKSILPEGTNRPVAEMASVMLPEQMVRLPDGRMGGPVSIVHAPFAKGFDPSVGQDTLFVQFNIFTRDPTQNDAWVIDEVLQLCTGECDAYWQSLARDIGYGTGTPEATPSTPVPALATPTVDSTIQPITPDECAVEPLTESEIADLTDDSGDFPPRSYEVAQGPDRALADQLAEVDRAWRSCLLFGSTQEQASLASARLISEGPIWAIYSGNELELLAKHDATRGLAAAISTGDWSDYYVDSSVFNEGGTAPLPEQAVALTDGRVAIPIAEFWSYPLLSEDFLRSPYVTIQVDILIQDSAQDGRWVVDEQIWLCLGDCDSYRQSLVQDIFERGLSPSAATPEATPVATPRAIAANPPLVSGIRRAEEISAE